MKLEDKIRDHLANNYSIAIASDGAEGYRCYLGLGDATVTFASVEAADPIEALTLALDGRGRPLVAPPDLVKRRHVPPAAIRRRDADDDLI